MDICVTDKRLSSAIDDEGVAKRRYGTDMARKLGLRLVALRAAISLADFWPPKSGPERCHELKGDREGTFSFDLKHPYRLLFQAIGAGVIQDRSNEFERWKSITAVEILAIEDTHE
jgi:plasmid maintenance system killer protein